MENVTIVIIGDFILFNYLALLTAMEKLLFVTM